MSCYCGVLVSPPCAWCENSFECNECGVTKGQEELETQSESGECVCSGCIESAMNAAAEKLNEPEEISPEKSEEEEERERLKEFWFGNIDPWTGR